MTKEQLNREILYLASITPFRDMCECGIISLEEYTAIDKMLIQKYDPLFIVYQYQNNVDIPEKQR